MTVSDQTKWLCDLAIKRLEGLHKDFDTLNGRAGSIIGYAGLFNTLLLPSWQKIDKSLRPPIGIAWLCLVFLMLVFAYDAYRVMTVYSLPAKRESIEKFNLMDDEEEARLQFISATVDASENMSKVNARKAYSLKLSILFFGLQILLSVFVIIVAGSYY